MMGGRRRYDPGRLKGAELAVGPTAMTSGALSALPPMPRDDGSGSGDEDGNRGEFLVCCLSSTGLLTTHSMPGASPLPTPSTVAMGRRASTNMMPGVLRPTTAAAAIAMSGRSPSPSFVKRLHPNFRVHAADGIEGARRQRRE